MMYEGREFLVKMEVLVRDLLPLTVRRFCFEEAGMPATAPAWCPEPSRGMCLVVGRDKYEAGLSLCVAMIRIAAKCHSRDLKICCTRKAQ